MKPAIALVLALVAMSAEVWAQSQIPYTTVLKVSPLHKQVEREGKTMIRVFVSSTNEATKREDVVFTLIRGDVVLAVIRPEPADFADRKADSPLRKYPWQITHGAAKLRPEQSNKS